MKPLHVALVAVGVIAVVYLISNSNWYHTYSLPSGTPSATKTAYPGYALQTQYYNG
jgi:hypothetical protein